MGQGILYLLPTPLGENGLEAIPDYVIRRIHQLDLFFAERPKTIRRFIKQTEHPQPQAELTVLELNKRTPYREIDELLAMLKAGKSAGLLSEAGCPGVADPGSRLVHLAHQEGIRVVPTVGPSSILLALMGSGMNGQQFCFHGYLPQKKPALVKELKHQEQLSRKLDQTQLFIETPYRNMALFETILKTLHPRTQLCVAVDLTLPTEQIRTLTVDQWKKQATPDLHKRPAIFLIFAGK